MNYQNKYLKYKNRYLQLKNQTGGSNINESTRIYNNIKKFKKELNTNEIKEIILVALNFFYKDIIEDLINFIDACNKIANFINLHGIKYLIAPGDSPSKFIKYIKKMNLCTNCIFITFSISNVGYQSPDLNYKLNNYIEKKLFKVDDLENTAIIDFISSGKTIDLIIEILETKFPKNNIIENFKEEINFIKNIDKRLHNYRCLEQNSPKKHIIDINYFIYDHLNYSEAEEKESRCEPRNDQYDEINNNSILGCELFIFCAFIFEKNRNNFLTIYENVIENNQKISQEILNIIKDLDQS
jgi:hypothetical protein